MDMTNRADVAALQSNLHVVFDTPQGREVMKFIEKIGGWYPTIYDPVDTNEIIGRDANRRLIGTIKTLMELPAEHIIQMRKNG